MRPRKGGCESVKLRSVVRFNGAAVVRPRKAGRSSAGRRRSHGFNGAAVVRPRKAHLGMVAWVGGPGFNGAAVVRPRKAQTRDRTSVSCGSLQRGRGRETAEGGRRALHRAEGGAASTGPRS